MELRQLRYFVAIAEELHFGRAAKRQHVVQSALSQQLHLLEHCLGVRLLDRDTHHVELTPAGRILLADARQILADVERTTSAVRHAKRQAPALRAGVSCADCDSVPIVLDELREQHPDLTVCQVEAGMTQQYAWLIDGRIDVGFSRACHAPAEIASTLFRLDPLGVLVHAEHPFARLAEVPVRMLANELIVLPDALRALGFTQLVTELCRSARVTPRFYPGALEPGQHASAAVADCVTCVPASYPPALPGTVWRPLAGSGAAYPWSVLRLARNASPQVQTVVACAKQTARRYGWLVERPGRDRALTGQR